MTSKGGKFEVEREKINMEETSFDASLIFEQDPNQLLDALLPLYMNSTVLRTLQVGPDAPRPASLIGARIPLFLCRRWSPGALASRGPPLLLL